MNGASTQAEERRIRRLGLRLLALVLVFGGAVAFLLAFGLSRLPPAGGDHLRFLVPGGNGAMTIDGRAVTVMAWAGAILSGLGALGMGLAGPVARLPFGTIGSPQARAPTARRSARSRLILIGGVALLVVALAVRFLRHARGLP